ncbi:hypothetical protein pEaSNUABM44_00076 [Erwinia phage pEa_SNUABM_44]|nr:hypothetical protein pEaSNUABM44_00076 [Erwinia phage pEa_SNUABM_44]
MSVSVIYRIKKLNHVDDYDIIIHEDNYYFEKGSTLVHGGGIREVLELKYPTDQFRINVEIAIHKD